MNKRKLHHLWVRLRLIRSWYFFAGFLIFGLIFIFAYRQNNVTALHLRDKILEVDKQNGDVEGALRDLREFTYGHMNAELSGGSNNIYPPIQLKYRYERLVQAEQDRVQASSGDLYHEAQAYCEKTSPESFYGAGRLPCIQSYLDSHGGPKATANPIPDAMYKFDFASPAWSPDLAGFSLFIALVFLFLFVVRFTLDRWLRHTLRDS